VDLEHTPSLPDARPHSERFRCGGREREFLAERRAPTGCCKLTLEVLENNTPAQRLYESVGFSQAQYSEAAGKAVFLWKLLPGA
jgi:ribosomal protein S18 acetylase RimI-like enzyme